MTQDSALSILKTGKNVFLTGEPGSGKTHTVYRYISYLRSHGIEPAITASTGIAATHIGGMTIHSWSGIGIKKMLNRHDLESLKKNKRLTTRARQTHILIIDEISMLDSKTFDSVDHALRVLRDTDAPFGGMQIVCVGDFFQLPPVSRYGEEKAVFAFFSTAWQEADLSICYLSEQYRQEDHEFLSLLTNLRNGSKSSDVYDVLTSRNQPTEDDNTYTRLYAHNIDVDRVNSERLALLPGNERTYSMISRGPSPLIFQLQKGCLSPEMLTLKKGARVMFTKNSFDDGYVNGTLAEVMDFDESGAPIVKTNNGREIAVSQTEWSMTDGGKTLATIVQLPLRLAWAITVHKSQGMTLDSAVMDLSRAFEYGQGYVALSRVRALSGLFLRGYNERALEVHPDILTADQKLKKLSDMTADAYKQISSEKWEKLKNTFILSSGGTIEKSTAHKNTNKRKRVKKQPKSTYDETLDLYRVGNSIEKIAIARDLTRGTIISHIQELFMRGKLSKDDISNLISADLRKKLPRIHTAFSEKGTEKLKPVFDKLGGTISYDNLRLARLLE